MRNAGEILQMIKTVITTTVLLGIAALPSGKQHDPRCCRALETEVRYTRPPSDITPPDDAGILQIDHSGGRVILTILQPNIPRDEFVGFSNYQELTTSDLGKTWRRRSLLDQVGSVLAARANDFAQAPSDSKVLYRYLQESGIYLRSGEGGRTWVLPEYKVGDLTKGEFILRNGGNTSYTAQFHLAGIDPRDPLKIYASVSVVPWASLVNFEGDLPRHDLPGLYVSADGGDSWKQLSDSLLNQAPIGLSSGDRNLMYGQTADGVVKSIDGGKTWVAIGQQKLMALPPRTRANEVSKKVLDSFEVLQFAIDPSDENMVYVVSNKGIYRSLDGGITWCLLEVGFDEIGGVHSMAMNPARPVEIFVGTTKGVFYSGDRGCHFERIYPVKGK
jgi:hypothetical protein